MAKIILLFHSLLFTAITFSQDRKDLTFSFAYGPSISFEYDNTKASDFVSFDMDYYFQRKHILSANFYDGSNSLPPRTNPSFQFLKSSAFYKGISLLYKFRAIDKKNFSFLVGAGWGTMEHHVDASLVWHDYVIPVRVESNFRISNHINASLIGGFFIMPDIPVVSYHLGPRISYVFK